jgi:hypothetical protein
MAGSQSGHDFFMAALGAMIAGRAALHDWNPDANRRVISPSRGGACAARQTVEK